MIAKLFAAEDVTDVFQIVSYHDEGTGYLELNLPDGSYILNDCKEKAQFAKQQDSDVWEETIQCDILTDGGILLVSYKYRPSTDPQANLATRIFPAQKSPENPEVAP
jgi:hypothetical protein